MVDKLRKALAELDRDADFLRAELLPKLDPWTTTRPAFSLAPWRSMPAGIF